MAETIIRPQPGKQTMFFQTPADIAIYGGAGGGGKTWGLTVEPLRHIHRKGFSGIIFRRTYPQIMNPGGLWDAVSNIYPFFKGKPSDSSWYFNQGSYETEINFSHMQYEKDKFNFQGAEIPFIGFDELTHFSQEQFFYLLSRNRSTCGIRPYVRGTCNPDPDSWLRHFLDWWIDPTTGLAIEERAGQIRYFFRQDGKFTWGSTKEEVCRLNPYASADLLKSVTFIPAKLEDNPILMEKDPGYKANLQSQDQYEQDILLWGNWNAKRRTGDLFFNPTYHEWNPTLANEAYLDPAYSGTNNTSLVLGNDDKTNYNVVGYTWRKSIEVLLDEILILCATNNVLKLNVEKNADKGTSKTLLNNRKKELIAKSDISNSIKMRLAALDINLIHEDENKHVRIKAYASREWHKIRFGYNTDPVYMTNLLNYREGKEPDDEADALTGLIRQFQAGFKFSFGRAN